MRLRPLLRRPDEKTNFTFLSYFQNEPETGYYGWLPKEGTVEPLPNGKRLPTDFNEGRQTTPILVTRKWWDTVSSMASTTLLPCARIYVLSK